MAHEVEGAKAVAAAACARRGAALVAGDNQLVAAAGCVLAAIDCWLELGAPKEALSEMLRMYADLAWRVTERPWRKA